MRRNSDDDDETPFDSRPDDSNQIEDLPGDGGRDAVDVHEYEDSVSVVADIPNISEADIDIQCDGRTLAIRIATQPHPVVLQVDLPTYVDNHSAKTRYNNGILEVTLDQDRDPANIGFQ